MKSPQDVQNMVVIQSIKEASFLFQSHVLHESKHTLHAVVRGLHSLGNTTSQFVQSFVLRRHRKPSILSDALIVLLNVPEQVKFKDQTDVIPVAEKPANEPQLLSRKVRIKIASRQATDKAKDSQAAAIGDSVKSQVLIVYNKECLQHVPGKFHRENPGRITKIIDALERDGVLKRVALQESDPADRKHVLAAHTEKLLLEVIDKLPMSDQELKVCPYISKKLGDMYASDGTKNAVYLAAGGVIKACESVANGDFKKAFALVRPPGHHASSEFSEGFCYINNAAIGVKYLQDRGLRKIMVVDIDVHHGNGSQSIFYEDDSVLVFSVHCKSRYPAKASLLHTCIGNGKGRGFNINVPLELGFGDADILYVIEQVLAPVVPVFKPEMIVVSAGFDAAKGDPLGECNVSRRCYGTITKKLVELANGYLVMILEGGYGEALGDSVSCSVRALLDDADACLNEKEMAALPPPKEDTVTTVRRLKKFLKKESPFHSY